MKLLTLLFSFTLIACATTKTPEPPLSEVPKASPPAAAATDLIENAAHTHAEKNMSEQKFAGLTPQEAEAAAKAAPVVVADSTKAEPAKTESLKVESVAKRVKGVPAAQARKWLENGNLRFVKNKLRKDGQSRKDIVRLSGSQKPHAIVVSCSDSRIPPEIVFDQKLGEIYVLRTLGESLDTSTIAIIEAAVRNLGPNLVVVLGHTDAGGEMWSNAKAVADDLKARSNVLAQGAVIQPAMYSLESGEVKFQ